MRVGCYTTEELAVYVVGGGSKKDRVQIEDHLRQCSVCRSEVSAIRNVGDLLDGMETKAAPDLWGSIAPNLAPRRGGLFQRAFTFPRRAYALAAAAAVFVLAAVMLINGPVDKMPEYYAEKIEHVDGHATMTWTDPFADKASLAVLAAQDLESESE